MTKSTNLCINVPIILCVLILLPGCPGNDEPAQTTFVASGGYMGAMTRGSADGTDWEEDRKFSVATGIFYSICYGDGRLVTVGQNGQGIAVSQYSTDRGVSYLAGNCGVGVIGQWLRGVAAGEAPWETPWMQYFVAVGDRGLTLYSTNGGVNWIQTDNSITTNLRGVAFGGGRFVAVGDRTSSDSPAAMIYSADGGKSWINCSAGVPDANMYGVAWGNGRFVAVGTDGTIVYSTNGAAWSPADSNCTTTLRAAAYGNGYWVAVGSFGEVRFSTDNGVNWVNRLNASPTTRALYAAAFRNGRFVAVGDRVVIYTDDGRDWIKAKEFTSYTETMWGLTAIP